MTLRFSGKNPLFRGVAAIFAACVVAGCISEPKPKDNEDFAALEETPLDAVISFTDSADRVVELHWPRLNTTLGPNGTGSLLAGFPTRVREAGTGEVIEYQWTRRDHGSWNAGLERDYNLFLLRSYFLPYQKAFDDTTGLSTTSALYERARLHDGFTRYYDSAQAEDIRRQLLTTEEPSAIGIQVQLNDAGDTIRFRLVAPGSPAWRAGIRRGMALLAVNDSTVTGPFAPERYLTFFDRDTAFVKLTVLGPQGAFTASLTRESVAFPTLIVDSLSGVGYIAILSFKGATVAGGSTLDEFRAALEATRRFGTTILDLRGNGGGSFNVALQMCDEVIGAGELFRSVQRRFTNGASLRYNQVFRAKSGEPSEGRRFLLLADSTSASASELFVAALRSRRDTPFRGTRTYGKAVGQGTFETPGKGYALVTYLRFTTASGQDYEGTGLMPTHPSTAKPDAMLAEAVLQAKELTKGLAKGLPKEAALLAALETDLEGRAALADWNRRQSRRPGVQPLLVPLDAGEP